MASTIITKNSSTASATPAVGDLQQGELAVNVTDKKVYTKDSSAAIVKLVGSLGNQEASAVAITGGSIAGITDLAVADGGTGSSTAAGARSNLSAAASGANSDITSLSGLTTALSVAQGGTGITSFGTGVATFLGTPSSANLLAAVTDETGTGALVFANSPTLITPALGTPASGNFSTGTFTWPTFNQNTTGTAAGLSATLAIASGGTGATTAGGALTSLGAYPASNPSGYTSNTGTVTSVGGTGTVNGLTLTGTVTTSGNLTLGGTLDLSSPPAIGGTAAAAGSFTTLTTSSTVTLNGGTANGLAYLNASKVLTSGSALTFDGTTLGNTKNDVTGTTELLNITRNNSGTFIKLVRNAGSGNAGGLIGADSVGTYYAGSTTANMMYVDTANTNLQFYANSAEGMRLTSTGLGIGTSSPSEKLEIYGTTPIFQINDRGLYQAQFGLIGNDLEIRGSSGVIEFYNGAADGASSTLKATLDSAGNLGLGVTPTSIQSGYKAIQIGATVGGGIVSAGTDTYFTNNAYVTGGAWYFGSTGYATYYNQSGGVHSWTTSTASGSGGGVATMSERMRLDSSGNLGVGTTSPSDYFSTASKFVIANTSGDVGMTIATSSTGTGNIFWADATSGTGEYSGYIQYVHTNDSLSFGTASTERARIDSSGNLLINTTDVDAGINGAVTKTQFSFRTASEGFRMSSTGSAYYNVGSGVATQYIYWKYSGTTVGNIAITSTATAYNTSSDYRLKNTIAPMTGALAKVALLKPVTYKWNADGSDGEGFIAHELAEVVPQCVTGEKDAVDENGNPKYQGIDTSFLVATLTAALQELNAKFDAYVASHP